VDINKATIYPGFINFPGFSWTVLEASSKHFIGWTADYDPVAFFDHSSRLATIE
jgi:hypothetical protein